MTTGMLSLCSLFFYIYLTGVDIDQCRKAFPVASEQLDTRKSPVYLTFLKLSKLAN